MCFGCSKEPSHRDGSYEYPQHMFWLRNKLNNFLLRTLIWGPASEKAEIMTFYGKGFTILAGTCENQFLGFPTK